MTPTTYRGPRRLTPTPAEIAALDAEVRAVATETGQSAYTAALHLLFYALDASSPGFARLAPTEEPWAARVRPAPLGAEVDTGRGG